MKFFDRLQAETAAERATLVAAPVIADALEGRMTLAQYTAFLEQAYHHVKHTLPLLMACGGRLPERLEWLRTAVAHYIEEETGHQEWILNDLAACGVDKEAIRRGQPGLAAELMVSYAYDTIQRRNPVGFFGMVQVLEGTSVNLATRAADAIQRGLGLPDAAFTYLRSHGELDVGHIGFFEKLMNRLELEEDRAAVVHVARVMYRLYGDMFRSLPARGEVAHAA
jgi:pyrroloquinoline quinone (PQQ) biosynthesis protein C